jgi:hypothetical protein
MTSSTLQNYPGNRVFIAGLMVLGLILLFGSGSLRAALSEKVNFSSTYADLMACPMVPCRVAQASFETIGIYLPSLESVSLTLKGQIQYSDLVQDVVGFRNLVNQQNAYPLVWQAAADLGLDWEIEHASTHPPTAFLLVAPVALLPWEIASAAWAWLMLILCVITFRCYGASWKMAIGLMPIALLWQPIAMALGQFTIIWLLMLALAYHFRDERQFGSGFAIGIASLSKFFPGLMTISFLLKRQWRALAGFVFVWALAITTLLLLHSNVLLQYLTVNQSTSREMILRPDNASLIVNMFRWSGWIGVFVTMSLFFLIIWVHKDSFRSPALYESPMHWFLLTYFSVALLPISWIYSLVPLLPIIIMLILRKKLSTMTIGFCCLLIPNVILPYGNSTVFPLVFVTLLLGIGLLVDGLPYRLFTAISLADLTHSPNLKNQ